MIEEIFPTWAWKLFSYISVFTLGMYAASSALGHPVEPYRWFITGGFGAMFFFFSLQKK